MKKKGSTSKVVIVFAIIIVAVLIGFLITSHETDGEKIVNYNRCVSAEMTKYYAKVRPLVEICGRGYDTVCKVVNDGIIKQKVEVQGVCNIYLK